MGSRGASSGRASIGSTGKNNDVEDIRTAIRNRMIEQGRAEREWLIPRLNRSNRPYTKEAKELLSMKSYGEAYLYLSQRPETEVRGIATRLNQRISVKREPRNRSRSRVIQELLSMPLFMATLKG